VLSQRDFHSGCYTFGTSAVRHNVMTRENRVIRVPAGDHGYRHASRIRTAASWATSLGENSSGTFNSTTMPYSMLVWSMVSCCVMGTARKITVEVPPDLLEKARRASGSGITQTVRTGLQLVAASGAYAQLRQFRGKIRFSRTLAELKSDR
jgi:hypothetical protein